MPRIKSLNKAHYFLCSKSRRYENWHSHPHHQKVHFGVACLSLILFFWFIGLLAFQALHHQAYAANHTTSVTAKADWEKGTLTNVDTEAARDSLQLSDAGAWGAKSLAEPPDNISIGSTFASDGTNVYVSPGGSLTYFWRYEPKSNNWVRLADAPYPMSYGGKYIYASNGNYVYGIFGGYLKKFARYSIATDTWENLPDTLDTIYAGGSLAYSPIDNKIYLARGGSSLAFDVYTPGGVWSSGAPLSAGTGTFGAGGSITYYQYGADRYLLEVGGGNTLKTYRYNITASTPTWVDTDAADITTGNAPNDDSSAIWLGDYIYTLRATNTQTWMRYTIASNTWNIYSTFPTYLPLAATGYSSGMAYSTNPDRLYVFQGNGTRRFWSVNPTTNPPSWIGPNEPVISGTAYTVTTGANLVSDNSRYLYMLRGSGGTQLLQYDSQANESTNPWSIISAAAPNVSLDTYGVKVGGYLYFITAAAQMQRYNIATPGWQTLTLTAPFNSFGNGGGLVYPGSGNIIYALRGNVAAGFYSFDTSNWAMGGWSDVPADLPQTNQGTVANIGARMSSNSTDIYALLGNGSSRFMRYNMALNTWYEDIAAAPFPAYYGTSVEYNGTDRIYATAGYYKNDLYEYIVSGAGANTWRKLRGAQQASTADIAFYGGASLAKLGDTLYALKGNATSDFYAYSISTNKYSSVGTYESQILDLSAVASWTSFSLTETTGANLVTVETRTSVDGVTWPDSYVGLNNGNIASVARRYLQVKLTLAEANSQMTSPVVGGYSVSYVGDSTPPTNPSSISQAKPSIDSEITLNQTTQYNYSSAYFEWPASGQAGGASDNQGGSGIKGYYVYFGPNSNADPANANDGGFFTANNFITTNKEMSVGDQFLRIKTVDNDSTSATETWSAFTYKYNGVSPSTSVQVTDQAKWAGGTLDQVNATQSGGNLQLLSSAGGWVQEGMALPPNTITTGSAAVVRPSENKIYVLRGGSREFYSYDYVNNVWNSNEGMIPGVNNVTTGGGLILGPGQYLYAWLGNVAGGTIFMRYDTATDTWDDSSGVSADMSIGVGAGSSGVYDGTRYAYITRGVSDDAVLRYDTTNNTWGTLPSAQFGNPANQFINAETKLLYDGNRTLYLLQSTGTTYFAKYTIPDDPSLLNGAWSSLEPSPIIFTNGTSATYDPTDQMIYAWGGNSREALARYSITSGQWQRLSDPPMSIGTSSSILAVGRNIYALRSGATQGFWKYDLDRQIWYKPITNTFGPNPSINLAGFNPYIWSVGAGASVMKGDGDYFYATRGNTDNQFIRYSRTTGEVTEMAPVPFGLTMGASLIYTGSSIYATTGNASLNFYKYTIATNSWSSVSTASTKLVPGTLGDGSDMAYDGSQFIYLTRGTAGTQVYKFNTADDTWVAPGLPVVPPNLPAAQGAGGSMTYAQNPSDGNYYLYVLRGVSTNNFYSWKSGDLAWTNSADSYPPVTVSSGGFITDGGNGKLYLGRGVLGTPVTDFYEYIIAANNWTKLTSAPSEWGIGGDMTGRNGEQIVGFLGQGGSTIRDGIYTYTISTANTGFSKTGSYISDSLDMSPDTGKEAAAYRWANLTINYTKPISTSLLIQTQSSSDGSSWDNLTAATNEVVLNNNSTHVFQINSPSNQYLKVKITLNSDGVYTPTVADYTVNYYLDQTSPTNPTALTSAKSAAAGGVDIANDQWNKFTQPSFTWPEANTTNGAIDNAGGSGVAGYYILFDKTTGDGLANGDCQGNPQTNAGLLTPNENLLYYQTSNTFTLPANILTSEKAYCLLVTSKDNAGNVQAVPWQAFKYKYDSTGPSAPATLTVSPDGYSSTDSFTFSMPSTSAYTGSEVSKYEYRVDDADPALSGSWHNIPINENHAQPTTYLLENSLCQTVGDVETCDNYEHTFFVRSIDSTGNPSVEKSKKFYLFRTTLQNLAVDNEEKSENEFAFTWDEPAGKPPSIEMNYYYLVNVNPADGFWEGNYKKTTALQISGDLAKKAGGKPVDLEAEDSGRNTFYVVAGIGGAINWGKPISVNFWANLPIPNPPTNIKLQDISARVDDELGLLPQSLAGDYRMVISWNAPEGYDETNQFFRVYATTTPNNINSYTQAAICTGLAAVHIGLTKDVKYYYYVKTVDDQTGIESVPSDNPLLTEVEKMPSKVATGEYDSPPFITTSEYCRVLTNNCTGRDQNVDVSIGAFTASFSWNLSRDADPKVRYGTNREKLDQNDLDQSDPEAGNETGDNLSVNISNPKVDLYSLIPETTYYYRLTFEGGGGGLGTYPPLTSEPLSFTTSKAPKVASLEVSKISLNSMTIKWESSVPSHGKVTFWKMSDRDSKDPDTRRIVEETVGDYPLVHTVDLNKADFGTEYRFVVSAIDKEGIVFQSDEYFATTLPMPLINNDLKAENVMGVDNPTITVAYTSNVPITTEISYSTGGGAKKSYLNSDRVIKHTAEISGLAPKAPYTLEVTGLDTSMNGAAVRTFQITTETDTMPPKIVSMSEKKRVIGDGANAEAQITVKVTSNEPTTMIVEAAEGVGGGVFNIVSNEDPLNAEHTVPLKLKQAGKTYSYRVSLKDAAGNPTISETKTVVIQQANKTAFEYTLSIFSRSFGWLSGMFKP